METKSQRLCTEISKVRRCSQVNPEKADHYYRRNMSPKKLLCGSGSACCNSLLTAHRCGAQSSDTARIEKTRARGGAIGKTERGPEGGGRQLEKTPGACGKGRC